MTDLIEVKTADLTGEALGWALGGPLVDKHRGGCQWNRQGASDACYYAGPGNSMHWHYGPTALVAFCRGLVHSKLGDSAQVPKELVP